MIATSSIINFIYFHLFHSGKSLLCKEGAIRMKKQPGNNQNVYYISLLASDIYGKLRDEYFTFDEASKIDLAGTRVKVLDVHLLYAMYRHRHPEISEEALKELTVYEVALDLIEADTKASYFFDETPFIASSTKWYDFAGKKIKQFIIPRLTVF